MAQCHLIVLYWGCNLVDHLFLNIPVLWYHYTKQAKDEGHSPREDESASKGRDVGATPKSSPQLLLVGERLAPWKG